MQPGYIPQLRLQSPLGAHPVSTAFAPAMPPTTGVKKLQALEETERSNGFQNVLSGTLNGINATMAAPDALMQRALVSNDVDVHDVMVANVKAELAVNVSAQFVTKIVQAYDRILQIQI